MICDDVMLKLYFKYLIIKNIVFCVLNRWFCFSRILIEFDELYVVFKMYLSVESMFSVGNCRR
jgi:hypothetical protein